MGSLKELSDLAVKNKWKKLFFVTGRSSFEKSGAKDVILAQFHEDKHAFFSDFEVNPKLDDVYKGIKAFLKSEADVIVSIGGGTAIDMAKLINSLSCAKGKLEEYAQGVRKIKKVAVPHVSVPTTSGSGSESTHFAVIYVGGKKYSMTSPFLLPSHVILDPELTLSLPPYITAYTAVDALCQAMESYWSVSSTDESSEYSLLSIQLILDNVRSAVYEPNIENRRSLQKAAYLAGKAINITKTTAAHALSYYLTSMYGIPHGHAVGLMFGWVFYQNSLVNESNCNDPRGVDFVLDRLNMICIPFGAKSNSDYIDIYYELMNDLKLRSSEIPFNNQMTIELLNSVNIERLVNNPVELNLTDNESITSFFKKYNIRN